MAASPEFPAAGVMPRTDTDPVQVGEYRVVGRLGAGGMGTVYAAVDGADSPAALKVVHREYAADPEFRARFAREVELVRRVRATCVPEFYAADAQGRRPWLATQYLAGRTLRQHVAAHGALTGGALLGLAAGTAEALAAIHGAGVVHRDLKPGNVILAPDGPKVLDFGIARAVEESGITRTGGVLGTPGWIAPERYRGAAPDAAADIFAWGGLVAFAATGCNPFGTGAPDVLAFRVMKEEPDLAGVPEQWRHLLASALAKSPDARPTAAEVLTAWTRLWEGTAAGDTAEATRLLPRLLDDYWRDVADPGAGTAQWVRLAPPKRPRWREPRTLALGAGVLVPVLLGAGGTLAWQALEDGTGAEPTAGTGAESGDGADSVASSDAGWTDSIGEVSAGHVANDTLEVATHQTVSDGVVSDGDSRVRITFDSAEQESTAVRFSGSAEYLTPEGEFVLRSTDFRAYANDSPDEHYVAETEEVLLALDAQNPTGDFSFAIEGAPTPGPHHLEFVVSEDLWGWQGELRWLLDDSSFNTPPWLCYETGPQWHGEPPDPVEGGGECR